MKRYAAKRDHNEPDIVRALEQVGATVLRIDEIDLIVGWRGSNYLLECKSRRGRLTEAQIKLRATWRGQYTVVRSVDEALKAIGAQ